MAISLAVFQDSTDLAVNNSLYSLRPKDASLGVFQWKPSGRAFREANRTLRPSVVVYDLLSILDRRGLHWMSH